MTDRRAVCKSIKVRRRRRRRRRSAPAIPGETTRPTGPFGARPNAGPNTKATTGWNEQQQKKLGKTRQVRNSWTTWWTGDGLFRWTRRKRSPRCDWTGQYGGGEGDRSDAGRSIADADKRRLFKTCISSMYRITSNVHAPPPPESRRLSSLPSLPSFRFSSEARSDQIVLDLIRFWKLWPSFTGFPFLWKGIKDFSIGNFMIIVEIISLNKIAAQYVSVGSYRVFFHTVYCHFWKWLSQLGNFSVNGNVAGCSTWKFDAFAFRLKRVLQHVRKWTFSR